MTFVPFTVNAATVLAPTLVMRARRAGRRDARGFRRET
jgi:hypothetical protein